MQPWSYTPSMKTAISLPDELFANLERIAARQGKPRSQIVQDALRAYIAKNDPESITDAMNRVVDETDAEALDFADAAAVAILQQVEW